MAGYCVIADVQALGTHSGQAYSATSKPSTTEVTAFIDLIYNRINGRLSAVGVTVPVVLGTSPIAFSMLKLLNAYGTAALAQGSTYFRANPNESSSAAFWQKQFDDILKEYCELPDMLKDAVFLTTKKVHPVGSAIWSKLSDIYDTSDVAVDMPLTASHIDDEY